MVHTVAREHNQPALDTREAIAAYFREFDLDTKDVAELLHVSPSSIRSAAIKGTLKSLQLGVHRRFRLSDVKAYAGIDQ